jgi:hypothetical protein
MNQVEFIEIVIVLVIFNIWRGEMDDSNTSILNDHETAIIKASACPHRCSIPRLHDKWCEKFKCICVEVTTCEGGE